MRAKEKIFERLTADGWLENDYSLSSQFMQFLVVIL